MSIHRRIIWVAALSLIMSGCTMGRLVTDDGQYAVEVAIGSDSTTNANTSPGTGHYAPFGIADLYAEYDQIQDGSDVFLVESEHIVGNPEDVIHNIAPIRNITNIPKENTPVVLVEKAHTTPQDNYVRANHIEQKVENDSFVNSRLLGFMLHYLPFVSLLGMVYSLMSLKPVRKGHEKKDTGNFGGVILYFALVLAFLCVIALVSVSLNIGI